VGNGEWVLVDSGEDTEAVAGNILDYLEGLGRPRLREIVVTHSHADHWGGARRVGAATGATLRAYNFEAWDAEKREALRDYPNVRPLRDGELIPIGARGLRAVHTPGHSPEHLCYFLEDEGILFSGDTILGIGTTVIQDLGAYMTSLAKLLDLHPRSRRCTPRSTGGCTRRRRGTCRRTWTSCWARGGSRAACGVGPDIFSSLREVPGGDQISRIEGQPSLTVRSLSGILRAG
jgi:glyoxylase-like metal-dependent hydrolase (beta-lactamase superfamily II)